MSFQSLAFFGFLAAALAVCLTAGRRSPRAGAAMLAAASAVFYLLGPGGWTVVLGGIACLLAGICVTAWAIRRMARSGGRRRTMVLACVYHIAILVGFKYTEFLTGGAVEVGWAPLGLSFFTFQQLWLLKEVYTGGFPSALRAVFPHRYLRPHSAARNLFPPAAGKGIPPSGLVRRRGGYLRHLLWHHQKGAAGGRLRHCGEQRLGTSGRAQRSGGLAGDFGVYAPAVL